MIQISKETRGAAPKLITPDGNVNKGLVLMMLTSVVVTDVEATNAEGDWSDFIGLKIPRLDFNFVEIATDKTKVPGIYRYNITLVPHMPNSNKYDWWMEQKPQMIKHLIDAFIGAENFRDEYAKLLVLPLKANTEMPAQEVLDAFRSFFEGVATVFNGDGKKLPCIFKDVNGKSLPLWGKLLLYVKDKPVNSGNYGFPGYPGDGVIELFKQGVAPSIAIKVAKGESITPTAQKAGAPVPNAAGAVTDATTSAIPDWMKG